MGDSEKDVTDVTPPPHQPDPPVAPATPVYDLPDPETQSLEEGVQPGDLQKTED
jgi:hypothetical protein